MRCRDESAGRRSSRTTTATVNDSYLSYLLKKDTMEEKQRVIVADKLCSHHKVFFPCLNRADHN